MKLGLFFIPIAACMPSCVTNDQQQQQPQPVDPIGTWSTVGSFTAGSCGLDGQRQEISRVIFERGDGTFGISGSPSDVETVNAEVTCGTNLCGLVLSESRAATELDGAFVLSIDGSIEASGTLAIFAPDGSSCSQNWATVGTLK